MALPFGKLAILVGAGVVGSILAKEGSLPSVSDVFSGAFKIALKGIKQDESTTSVKKPRNDFLMAQVSSLREELQLLASNRPVTIVTATGTSGSRYGVVVIVVVVGYGYVRWKGWKLPDLMFATRRSLSEARNSIAKQLENVYSSIGATKRHLSSRMDSVDNNLDEVAQLTASTRETVSGISAEMETINANVAVVRDAVENLGSKIGRIEGKQNMTAKGVLYLCNFASTLGPNEPKERIQASPSTSKAPLEAPPTPLSRINSLPRGLLLELSSSSNSNEYHQERNGEPAGAESSTTPPAANGTQTPEATSSNQSSSYGLFTRRLSSINPASFISRTHSLGSAVLQQVRQSSQQS
ncbi:uncharacterized protein LOC116201203 isoform X1 [Punica granatum]|uniref:Uncharacterized protein LOC116201203 isoform X1 n=1 Tax=Punica granatum TaxID=22663 RepID=A0A6P8D3M1_PUNGR|nr:uncharacterized protein LOC116201203 isoform X1 [Punica granatum]